ncbi:MAG: ATP-binding cassette domain-containing protein [Anaerolineaceae bacterium]|nr:ATP-binding cassette domain-containing protein [Anaerolineaceae bacterium]
MIELRNLSKQFETADGTVEALKNINLTIQDGDIYGIIGMSGAGKSTLVRCVNMLEKPSDGSVYWDGKDLGSLSEKELRAMRRRITMIFQSFNLLMQKTCLDNVILPLLLAGTRKSEAEKKGMELLKMVGLPDKAKSYPAQLSGGQQQRVAIARALTTEPSVLLCDEATSALDPKTTHAILDLIREINQKLHITVIVITHQMSVVQEICNRVAILEHGTVVEEGEVSEVFSNPRANATRNLIYPELEDGVAVLSEGGQKIRVIFNGAVASREPLIAKMAVDCGILGSILGASTRSVGDRAYGYIVLEIPGTPEDLGRAITYLSQIPDITVQVEAEYGSKEAKS